MTFVAKGETDENTKAISNKVATLLMIQMLMISLGVVKWLSISGVPPKFSMRLRGIASPGPWIVAVASRSVQDGA